MENGAFLFTAMDTRTTLSFMSLMPAPNSHGALVDNVSVRAPVLLRLSEYQLPKT